MRWLTRGGYIADVDMDKLVMTTLPILILFLLGQRYFTEGIALTGLK